ncbi:MULTISPECIES: SDR family oxidoreductase [unclassified Microbacterium]|uniref:SDR family NAD(P)-dependent oxidoreductase n=1 Tax=unclassified Microbacterium TaxID=2609290 RepID=UPI00214C2B51|nr:MULTISPECIES: SDR family oxidoreductase [unclassified Microbacterium]MCR2783908.1 SDR family oxidoreductase [Microbacterium sp. zg.B96]MDL5351300.1 SDR family oxidoreductase [Microbacterium sp. zg-YB36]WIM15247.1 SDR family oxidoreductase [Microbacterium sp. zg-B96]
MNSAEAKVVAITGGSRGIGAAIARRLAADGFRVAIGYRADEASADALVDEMLAQGYVAQSFLVDITDFDSLERFLDGAIEMGELVGVVGNAGAVRAVGVLTSLDPSEIRRDIDVNFLGPVLTCRAAATRLADTGGSIVLIGSAATTSGSPGTYVHYAAAKSAVATLTVGLARELASSGVRVNCVEPGTIWTDFHADPERPAKVASSIPLGRAGSPEEIAGAVAWFLSADAAYATGAVLRVAGGL